MAQQTYPPTQIVRTLLDHFFPARGLALAPRGLAPGEAPPAFGPDRVLSDMNQFQCVRLDALRETPRGGRDWVVVLVLAENKKYTLHGPDLRKLLQGVESERAARDERLDEVIVVATDAFFEKKNLTEVVREFQLKHPPGPDPEGAAAFFSAYPYSTFVTDILNHVAVPPHRIMAPAEVAALLAAHRLTLPDFPAVLATDSPIVWIGGREGQLVEITRDSQTAGSAIAYRRIVRALW